MDTQEKREKTILIMACGVIGISFLYLFLVTFVRIPESGSDHAKTIVGFLLGVGLGTLLAYYWGSSSGSAYKSKTIENKLDGTKPPEEVKPKP